MDILSDSFPSWAFAPPALTTMLPPLMLIFSLLLELGVTPDKSTWGYRKLNRFSGNGYFEDSR